MSTHAPSGYPLEPRLLRVREVATLLAVSEPTVWRLTHAGELTRVRVGGSTRFLLSDVESLVRRGARSRTTEKERDPASGPSLVEETAVRGSRHGET